METGDVGEPYLVACGAASHLRLKRRVRVCFPCARLRRMWSGFSSEIETPGVVSQQWPGDSRMWSGFSSEIETPTRHVNKLPRITSHVERLLI